LPVAGGVEVFLRFRRSTPIADTVVGTLAVVTGVVEAETELYLLETRVPCAYYEAVYESYRRGVRGRGRPLWLPDRFARKCAGLIIRDRSGVIRVAADADHLVLHGGHRHSERLGRAGRRRVVAHFLRSGDRVKLRGVVSPPPIDGPAEEPRLAAEPGGRVEIVVLR
jgi:hypothetical protein